MAYKVRWDEGVYYTVAEVCKFLGFHDDWVRARFKNFEPPLVLKSRALIPRRRVRSDFVTLRIMGAAITMVAATLK